MSQKVAIIADPGIDTAFAIALALHDPNLDVVALVPTGGNVTPEQATRNAHILVNQIDPPKWPRVGSALPVNYDLDGERLHGPGGLGGVDFPYIEPRQQTPADELLVEVIQAEPGEVTLMILGPATAAATALGCDPEIAPHIAGFVLVGGTRHEAGNAGPVSEFHFRCDPRAARQVIHSGPKVTVVPLDVSRQLVFSPKDLSDLSDRDSRTARFLSRVMPFGIRACSNLYGVEGFHLKDVAGLLALGEPSAMEFEEAWLDVETVGELTRGMSVIDTRPGLAPPPNVFLATGLDVGAAWMYIQERLGEAV